MNQKAEAWWELSLTSLGEALKQTFKRAANPMNNPRMADEWEPYLEEKRTEQTGLTTALNDVEAELNDPGLSIRRTERRCDKGWRMDKKTIFTKEEACAYFWGFREHFTAWVGGAAVTVLSLVFNLSPWIVWPWLGIGVFLTGFFVWRDEHRKLQTTEDRLKREDVLVSTSKAMMEGSTAFAALLASGGSKLPNDDDVIWICDELVRHDRKHPLPCLKQIVNPLEGAPLLEFLRSAILSGIEFKKDLQFYSYANRWAYNRGWHSPGSRRDYQLSEPEPIPQFPDAVFSISAEQETAMLRFLKATPKAKVAVVCPMNNKELSDFVGKMSNLLKDSGFSQNDMMHGCIQATPLYQFPYGVSVYANENKTTKETVDGIRSALSVIGIDCAKVERSVLRGDDRDKWDIHVIVGPITPPLQEMA